MSFWLQIIQAGGCFIFRTIFFNDNCLLCTNLSFSLSIAISLLLLSILTNLMHFFVFLTSTLVLFEFLKNSPPMLDFGIGGYTAVHTPFCISPSAIYPTFLDLILIMFYIIPRSLSLFLLRFNFPTNLTELFINIQKCP